MGWRKEAQIVQENEGLRGSLKIGGSLEIGVSWEIVE